jgi:hypothetical protein
VTNREAVANAAKVHAEIIYSSVVIFARAGSEKAGVYSGLLEEIPVLGLLMLKGLDEGTQGFVGLATAKLFNTKCFAEWAH